MSYVEELSCAQKLGGLDFVAAQLSNAPFDTVGVHRVLVLDNGDRHAVHYEHHVGAVAFAGRWLEPPLPCHVQDVGAGFVEIDKRDLSMTLLVLVIPLPLAS